MKVRWRSWLLGSVLLVPAMARADDELESLFESRVRPVLVQACFRCHGGDRTALGLRVDSRDALLKGGKNGPAIVPGKPELSRMLSAIEYRDDAAVQMPPDGKLPAETIAAIALWIKQGAPWPEAKPGTPSFAHAAHWAYQPMRPVEPPGDPAFAADHPIDRFIAACWREHNLHPVAPADRRVLVRRLYFDLVGLPPSPRDVDDHLADNSAAAWEKLIDRLLASPQYGERWGRHWMDVVRYADTAGDNADYPVPEARLYRDYIIDSFNSDKPYDQFVREQVAGDLLAAETAAGDPARERFAEKFAEKFAEQTIATGFLAVSRRYATAPYELWHLTLEDTIDTVGRAFLGQTFKCARCHDHKFDPVTQDDYYALYGIFASTQFPWAGGEEYASKQFGRQFFAPLIPPAEAAPLQAAQSETARQLEEQIKSLDANDDKEKIAKVKGVLRELLRTGVPAGVPCAYAVCEGSPADVPLQQKGNPVQPGPIVPRRMPAFLSSAPGEPIPAGHSGRLQLARWLTRAEHPLTARVMVNRIWQQHFGKGLVATPSNFGTRGDAPTHPELLDWLALHFVERGWSIKDLHRLILTSRVWRLSSDDDEKNAAADPENRFLWRSNRRRLDAEAIRDALLSVAGTLDLARPAGHPFPDIKTWTWTQHKPFKDVYPSSHRSVYLMTQRIQRHPFLALFDGPDTNTTTENRTSSTVPLQALFWMNSPLVEEQADRFARSLLAAGDPPSRVRLAFESAYGRNPSPAESERLIGYASRYEDEFLRAGGDETRVELEAWKSIARVILSGNEFLYLD